MGPLDSNTGIEKVQTEMDTDKSGHIDKSAAEQWWLRNCSRDLRFVFYMMYFAIDEVWC